MKKLIALLLTFALLLVLCACGSDEKNQETKPTNAPDSTTGPAEEEETTKQFDIGEIIVADNADCSVKITGMEIDALWGLALRVQIENRTEDASRVVCVDSAAINGVQCASFFSVDVTAGKKANEDITFATEILDDGGVGDYTDIELTFRVYDPEGYGDDLVKETVHVYPYGEDKAVCFEREPQSDDLVIVDNDYVKIVVTDTAFDETWGFAVNMFLQSKCDKNVTISTDEVSVNDFMMDPFYTEILYAGKSAFSTISWFGDDLANCEITEVEKAEFLLRMTDHDDWFADELACETIVLNP